MPQRRNPRTGVEDRWRKTDPETRKKVPSANDGQGKRWRARWVEADGTERSKGFTRKTDAEKHISSIVTQVTRGEYVPPEGPETLLRTVVEGWQSGLDVKRSTRSGYDSIVKVHIMPRWGAVPLKAVTPSSVRTWLAEIQTGDDAVSSGYARKCGLVLQMILSSAVQDRLLPRSPMEKMKLPKPSAPRRGYSLTEAQAAALMKHMPTEADRTITAVLAYAGLRWGEAISLRPIAVDVKRRRIHVQRTYIELSGRVSVETPKSHELRWVPAPKFLIERLKSAMVGKGEGDDLFVNRQGKPLAGTNWMSRVLRPALTAAGVPDAEKRTIHDLRHTYASLAVQAGANIKQLQRAMGHASATITLDTYADLFDDDFAGLGDRLEPTADVLRTMAPDDTENS